MAAANADEIGELLEDRAVDESLVDRLANTGASLDEIGEAMEDLEYERRFGETREPSSTRIAEVRTILEEITGGDDLDADEDEDEEHPGLSIVEPEELGPEPP